eukprot:gene33384-43161_t
MKKMKEGTAQKKVSKSLRDVLTKHKKGGSSNKEANKKRPPNPVDQTKSTKKSPSSKKETNIKKTPVKKTIKKNDSTIKSVSSKTATDSKSSWKTERPNVKLVETLKPDWNKVRDRSTKDKARETTIKKMMVQMTGNVLKVTLRHDASRMVQSILQFGNTEQKTIILKELCKAVEIAKTPYGHFS